jgi:hypothetical protein
VSIARAAPLVIAFAILASAATARADDDVPDLAIAVNVATENGHPVVDPAWVEAQIAEANRLYAVIPLRFHTVSVENGDHPAHVVTREDRDACVTALTPGAINLRVVASLMDVDEPGVVRRGVHWRHRAIPQRRIIILSSIAAPTILAHELGHYFGNPHSPRADNLMSYTRTGAPLFLDEKQRARVRAYLKKQL